MLTFVNATIVDGSGVEPFRGSVLCEGDRIIEVRQGPAQDQNSAIDCTGLAIAPGFLDLHSHSDLQVLDSARSEKAKQGVTAELVGNCGFSPFPADGHAAEIRDFARGIFREDSNWGWNSAREYLTAAAAPACPVDVFALVGHGSLWVAAAGFRQQMTSQERSKMARMLEAALDDGCAGLSTGLMYAPGSSAEPADIEPLLRLVAARDRLYATHMRGYSSGLLAAIREQIAMARNTGCRLQISHLQATGRMNWKLMPQALEEIESARREGIDVEFDIYPYQCGSTVLTQWLPRWALDGGTDEMCRRLSNVDDRRRIAEEVTATIPQGWEDITITGVRSDKNAVIVGKTLAQIARIWRAEPVDAMLELLFEERGAVNTVAFNQSEENLRTVITHPLCSVISDGFYVRGLPHPRLHGTFPELLGTVVREKTWMTLAEAVHKITAKPAARLKLKDRGLIAAGYRADLVLFDPQRIASPATYERPEQDPVGIARVYSGGKRQL
jgi:dihydroorotase/N-acyl-D-amino-acid deacylase